MSQIFYTRMVTVTVDDDCIQNATRGDDTASMVHRACKKVGLPILSAFVDLQFGCQRVDGLDIKLIPVPEKLQRVMSAWDDGVNPSPFAFDIYFDRDQPVYVSRMRSAASPAVRQPEPRAQTMPAVRQNTLPAVQQNTLPAVIEYLPGFRHAVQVRAEELVRNEIARLRSLFGIEESFIWFSFNRDEMHHDA